MRGWPRLVLARLILNRLPLLVRYLQPHSQSAPPLSYGGVYRILKVKTDYTTLSCTPKYRSSTSYRTSLKGSHLNLQ